MDLSVVKAWLKNRLPRFQDALGVYGVIAIIVYGWTIYWFTWRLPSYLYFQSLGDSLSILAYAMVINFLESLVVLAGCVFLCFLLPLRWYRDQFSTWGTSLAVLFLLALVQYPKIILKLQSIQLNERWAALLLLAMILLSLLVIGRVTLLQKIASEIANRAVIFLYILLPLTAVSVVVVVARNIIEVFNGRN